MANLLGREEILRAQDLETKDVAVPEWGGTVRVRALTGSERDQFEAGTVIQQGKTMRLNLGNVRARLVALSVVDEEGQQIFSASDVEALGQKSAAALNRVASVAQQMSGLSDGDMEELTENFPLGRNGNSTSI